MDNGLNCPKCNRFGTDVYAEPAGLGTYVEYLTCACGHEWERRFELTAVDYCLEEDDICGL
jgi:hypothetical protein